jgi:hypothetical protein
MWTFVLVFNNIISFSYGCITEWRKLKPECPVCRCKIVTLLYNFNLETNEYEKSEETPSTDYIWRPEDNSSPYDCLDRQFFVEEIMTVLSNADYMLTDLRGKRSAYLSQHKYIPQRSPIERRWNVVNQVRNELLSLETEFKYSERMFNPQMSLARLYELQNLLFHEEVEEYDDEDEEDTYEYEYEYEEEFY